MLERSAGLAAELKQQGAFEAAADPNASTTAEQAQKKMVDESRAAGAPAFQFDPDASPEQKAEQLRQQANGQALHRQHQVAALVSDVDDGKTAGYDLPPPSKAGAIAAPSKDATNGSAAKEPDDEVYKKTGWAPRFGNPGDKDEEATLLDHQTFLEGKLDDKFFGDWYHNTGVIIFACLATYVTTLLGAGLTGVFIILAFCSTYYRTSIRRARRNYRDDITRELAKNKLETDTESLEWMNSFLVKFWPIYAPVICKTIIQSVDQVLSTSTPAFLDSMRLKSFTLGTKPPRMEHVKTYPKADDDTVMMDWKFSFTPNDTMDLTARQLKNKINPKIVLEVRVGKAMISKGLDIIVEDMACTGTMRVKMKLQLPFPHVERIEICFLGRPTFDYVCKPIGGDMLGFDINFVPGLEKFIQEQIHANLAPMMYDPNVFPIEVAKMLAGNPVDQAIGVLQIQFHGAQGLKNPDKFSGTPDPYANVTINNREVLGKTKTVHESASPKWNETVNVILTSLREPLVIQVFDYNEFRKDKELGSCTFNLEQLQENQEQNNLQLEVIAGGRPRGVVQCDINFFPVLEGQKLADGTEVPAPESNTGIAKFTVEQAKDLDGTKSLIGQLNPYAVLLLNGKDVTHSQKLKRTNNPIWPDATKEMLITDRRKAKLGLVIKDDRGLTADPILGTYQIKLDDMLDLMNKGQEWYNLAGAKTGRVKMMLQWKPVALRGAIAGGGYVTPIGVMRFHFQKGTDLKNLDTVGKSDPYARVLLSGIEKARTVTWQNNLNPEWDEVFYVPVHSTREKLVVEVMDEESSQADRTMGQYEIETKEYVQQDSNGNYLVRDTKDKLISAPVRIGTNPPKGTIHFTVAFYPCENVVDPEEEERDAGRSSAEASARTSLELPPSDGAASKPRHERSNTAGTISSLKTVSTQDGETDLKKALSNGEKQQEEEVKTEQPKIRISAEDLSKYETGLIIFKMLDAELAHSNTYLEVLMDDMLFPAYSSAKAQGSKYTFNETGDAMVRELDLSKITLRLVNQVDKKGENKSSAVKAKITGNTLDVLKRSLYTPTQLTLKDNEGRESRITVSTRFLPVKMSLDPSESFNNSGNLRVEVLDADDLPAADRNGFSDPYCRFYLNGKELHKTKVQKKTLHPAWNEFFETQVRSRTAAKFEAKVYDWDFGDKADFLGAAWIPLDVLEPFKAQEVTLALDGKSGVLRLKLLFKPDYVMRSRQGSSTFSGSFGTPGKVIGAPVKGVAKGATMVGGVAIGGVSAVGGGVLKGAGFLGRGFKRRDKGSVEETGSVIDAQDASMDVPVPSIEEPITNGSSPAAYAAASPHRRETSVGAASLAPSQAPGADRGTATITVLAASGFPGDHKLEIVVYQETSKGSRKVMETDHPKPNPDGEWRYAHATKKISCSADTQYKVAAKEHKTFGSDTLGEAPFFINDQGSGGRQEVKVGSGVVILETSFAPADAASMPGAESPAGKSGLGRLMNRRSVTPSG